MRTFKIYSPGADTTNLVKAKDHKDAAKRWARENLYRAGDTAEIYVSGLNESKSKTIHVEMGILVEEIP